MQNDFLKQLNKEQKEAVLQANGPMIILAGAGSGKTRCITFKVIYLLEKDIHPSEILCVTFTNKAAQEMKERITTFLGNKQKTSPLIATFHSLCAKILRVDGRHIGLSSSFAIYDIQDQLDVIKLAMQQRDISTKDVKPHSALSTISQAKNELVDASSYKTLARGYFQGKIAEIYPIYTKILSENDAVDFDDLIFKTIQLFQKNPEILEKYQNRFRYILVDEYQDTNHAQYTLTKLLAAKWKNICVVGDFSQGIYSWRGADFQNLKKFQEDFSGVKTFSLSQNYRSTQKILDAASTVIKRNITHPVLKLWTENPDGDDIVIYEAKSEQDEAEFIIHQLLQEKYYGAKKEKISFSDAAVLYRTNAQSRALEEIFLHQGIPYILVGGTRFYERKEIKDILSYVRLLTNPKDSVSYKRVEKLGKGRLAKFLAYGADYDEKRKQQVREKTTIELLDTLIAATDYLSLYDEKDQEDRQRLENIKELRSVAIQFPNLTQFLENVALVEQEYMPDNTTYGDKKNAITLMTLHAAKGLEFPFVFMVGMEEGLFPHSRSLMDKNQLEEERRLCYVGMTRARKKLYLSYARKRLFFGQRTQNVVSRFVFELPEKVINKHIDLLGRNDNSSDFL